MSRKRLVEELGLGEGSVRTILKKLKKEGLSASNRQGHGLTAEGERILAIYCGEFTEPIEAPSKDLGELAGEEQRYALMVVRGGRGNVGNGMAQRDAAYSAGAAGAAVLVYEDCDLSFPGSDVRPSELKKLDAYLSSISLDEGDCIIIGFAETCALAADGAVAAALEIKDPGLL